MMRTVRWSFARQDGDWIPARTPYIGDNIQLAVETLIIPFGRNPDMVDNYLEVWRKMELEHGTEYALSTPAAVAERISCDTVEICDLYDQFEDVCLPVEEFVNLLEVLSVTMRAARAGAGPHGGVG